LGSYPTLQRFLQRRQALNDAITLHDVENLLVTLRVVL
jgi:hypothetical protein